MDKNKPYRIAFDIDDTINNFLEICIEKLNEISNDKEPLYQPLSIADFKEWDIHKTLSPTTADRLERIFNSQSIWNMILPVPGIQDLISELYSMGIEIYFVTACDEQTHFVKSKWLEHYFPFIPRDNYIYIGRHQKKLLDVDIIIDDNPAYLEGCNGIRILIDKPWNKNANISQYDVIAGNESVAYIKDLRTILLHYFNIAKEYNVNAMYARKVLDKETSLSN